MRKNGGITHLQYEDSRLAGQFRLLVHQVQHLGDRESRASVSAEDPARSTVRRDKHNQAVDVSRYCNKTTTDRMKRTVHGPVLNPVLSPVPSLVLSPALSLIPSFVLCPVPRFLRY